MTDEHGESDDLEKLEEKLDDELLATTDIFKKAKPPYHPNEFRRMLNEHKAVATVKKLLASNKDIKDYKGLYRLWEMANMDKVKVPDALDCSAEAIVYNNEKYRKLFTAEEINTCKERLTALDYFKKRNER